MTMREKMQDAACNTVGWLWLLSWPVAIAIAAAVMAGGCDSNDVPFTKYESEPLVSGNGNTVTLNQVYVEGTSNQGNLDQSEEMIGK